MNLSILLPTNRPDKLELFEDSLRRNTSGNHKIELIKLVDDEQEYIEMHHDNAVIHQKPNGGNVGQMMYECLKLATGGWIFFGNDDIICETPSWDERLAQAISDNDEYTLFWPDDNMFHDKLSCFPIVSRKSLELMQLFPTPYKRYKIDDTIFDFFPPERKKYLPNILFRHSNDNGKEGFQLPDGRIYPIDRSVSYWDETEWERLKWHRQNTKNKLYLTVNGNEKIKEKETKVLITVPTCEMARRAAFYDYYDMLDKPEGTMSIKVHGQSPGRNRNIAVQQALEYGCTHILFIDDDMTFPPNLLTELLKHDKDIVTALYLKREYPHMPLIFTNPDELGRVQAYYPKDNESGLIEISACGLGAILIKTEVFRKVEAPWVRLGEFEGEEDNWCDDIGFFKRVREAEFKIFCDLSIQVGHMASVTIYPCLMNKKWHTAYETNGTGRVAFESLRPK